MTRKVHGGVVLSKTRKLLLEYDTEEVGRLARGHVSEKKALIKAFTDSSDVVRERALIAAIDVSDPTIVTEIIKVLDDDTTNVRIAAAQALTFYHQPRTVPNMIRGLKDTSPWVRSHCAAGLAKMLNGPIWARLSEESIDKILDDFPDMEEIEINKFLATIELKPGAINRFMEWRTKKFDIEIDVTSLVEELEGTPILLSGGIRDSSEIAPSKSFGGLSEDVETILGELPNEILATLPPEDLRRLTPQSARELVQKLKVSLPSTDKKKKAVKVRKVTKVKKKTKGPTSHSLIKQLPPEVRESISDETLASLSIDELQALLASSAPDVVESEEVDIAESVIEYDDPRMTEFVEKYGEEKANILITIPEAMLEGIPEEQIIEMDIETLEGLKQALKPR
ncbi:MAG: HEAT repeat domain-containing protein [Candidatus Thorarchaeota archaeon]|nr:MAG: HEAT repeat domain-containing protein [Candidatus Thorarchaeota archaeon]